MKVTWESGFDPSVLIERMNKTLSGSGTSISYSGNSLDECISLARAMLRFEATVAWDVKESIISKAVAATLAKNGYTEKDFLTFIKKKTSDHFSKPVNPYILITTLGITPTTALPSVKLGPVSISFPTKLQQDFSSKRGEHFKRASGWLNVSKDDLPQFVRVRVLARSPIEAGEAALEAVDHLRGILNLLTSHGWRRTHMGPPKPVNRVRLGPLHTLHTQDNKIEEVFWYEPNYIQHHERINLSKNEQKVISNLSILRRRLSKLPYRNDVDGALVRYARALDGIDFDASFIKLWGILEQLTDTGRSTYDRTISRASFLFQDTSYHRAVLEHLRRYRNRSVHAGRAGADIEVEIYQLKKYVEQLFFFHIQNPFHFKTFSDACAFLDLPTDKGRIKEQIKNLKYGLKFLGP